MEQWTEPEPPSRKGGGVWRGLKLWTGRIMHGLGAVLTALGVVTVTISIVWSFFTFVLFMDVLWDHYHEAEAPEPRTTTEVTTRVVEDGVMEYSIRRVPIE